MSPVSGSPRCAKARSAPSATVRAGSGAPGNRKSRPNAVVISRSHATRSLHTPVAEDGVPLQDTLVATGHPDDDPVAKTLGRERLRAILDGTRALTELERSALELSANDRTHRDSAHELGVGERAVNNALQRARRSLAGPAIPSTATASRVARHAART
jgi:DNA-directed RNA polymerase specialized sigma24 family protein